MFGHLGSFKGWIQTEACVIPSYHGMLIQKSRNRETNRDIISIAFVPSKQKLFVQPKLNHNEVKLNESDLKQNMVTHTRNSCSAFTHPSAHTHSSEHTHTVNPTQLEHTPGAVGSHLCCGARGAVGGSVPCSRAPRRGIEGGERALYIHSPHLQSLPDRS